MAEGAKKSVLPFGPSQTQLLAMAVVLNFATFKATVLRKIDEIFPDRLAQLREQERLISGGGALDEFHTSHDTYEATILASFLNKLRDVQRRNSSFASSDHVEDEVAKMTLICDQTNFKFVTPPVLAQIESILQHYNAICLHHAIFTMHSQIYANSAQRTLEFYN